MSQRIPLVFFSNSQERGGAEEHVLTLLRGLSREHFQFHLVCPPIVARAVESDLPKDVEVAEIDLCSPKHVGAAGKLFSYLRKTKAEILHSHLFYASFFASPVGKLARVPVVIETPHVREQWRKGWKASYRIDRFAGKFVDHYIAVSAANKKYLVEEKKLPAQKISVILNGSDLRKFSHYSPSLNLRAQLGIGSNNPVVLVPARLAPQKGHTFLLDAAPSIVEAFPSVRFVCLGDGELKTELMGKADRLGVAPNFLWLGFQNNMPEWYAFADVVALPSLFEGLPLAMIEALASGRAAVATAVDGTPEIVVNERTGLLVAPGNPQQLSAAIVRMLSDASLRKRLGDAGVQWVTDNFSDARQIAATEELYLDLVEQRLGGSDRIRKSQTSVHTEEKEAASLTRQ
jgi:glycosyltransferase involved in cell wall biosynthesis